MNKPFLIYFDIDGVLVLYLKLKDRHEDGKHLFVSEAVNVLNTIITMFDADLCIVSTWGRGKDPNEFKKFLISRGIMVNNFPLEIATIVQDTSLK